MIDPFNCTKYDRTINELQEFLLFSILVANKRADTTAKNLQKLLERLALDNNVVFDITKHKPFDLFDGFNNSGLAEILSEEGFGCYNLKAEAILDVVKSEAEEWLDILSPEPEEYERIIGIGPKTSRYYILHTQRDAKVIPLDTHALKFLKHNGVAVPASTPQSIKKYKELESAYIALCPPDKTLAQFDLEIWKKYTRSEQI